MALINNKKAIAPFLILGVIVLTLVVIYIILYLPIPAFAKIKNLINYILILIAWIVLQIGLILGYFYAGKYVVKGVKIYKGKIQKKFLNLKHILIMRS